MDFLDHNRQDLSIRDAETDMMRCYVHRGQVLVLFTFIMAENT